MFKEKNNVIRDLSSCVIKKFNGYSILKAEIKDEEKKVRKNCDLKLAMNLQNNDLVRFYCSKRTFVFKEYLF